jgi:hypothetical protein
MEEFVGRLTDLWEAEAWSNEAVIPGLGKMIQRSLPGIETPGQVSSRINNLAQFKRFLTDKVKTYPAIGGSLLPRELQPIDGKITYVFNRVRDNDKNILGSVTVDPNTKQIAGTDLTRLTPEEQELVNNWIERNAFSKSYTPSMPMPSLHENIAKTGRVSSGRTRQNSQNHDILNYQGGDHHIRSLLAKAGHEVGAKQNHVELLMAFLAKKEEEHQAYIEKLMADNEVQRDEIAKLVNDIASKEKRFQDFNQQVTQMQNVPVQTQAAMAQGQATGQPVKQHHQQPANQTQYRQTAESIMEVVIPGLSKLIGNFDNKILQDLKVMSAREFEHEHNMTREEFLAHFNKQQADMYAQLDKDLAPTPQPPVGWSKQACINYFVSKGKTAEQGAMAYESGWWPGKPKKNTPVKEINMGALVRPIVKNITRGEEEVAAMQAAKDLAQQPRSAMSDIATGKGNGAELKTDPDYRREQRRTAQQRSAQQKVNDRVKAGYGEDDDVYPWMKESLETLSSRLTNLWEDEVLSEKWSQKYKKSINCSHPKGFSQRAHCQGKKKHNESHEVMEMVCEDCGMCQSHGNMSLNEIKKGAKDSNGFTKCWPGKHAEGTKKGKNGKPVRNCVPNESIEEDWNKVNHHDKTNGLSQKAVNAYRREHPGSKLKTAVTTKPSKLKAGSKDAKRRKSFCARMSGNKGPMKKPNGKPTPKALALRRWNCE